MPTIRLCYEKEYIHYSRFLTFLHLENKFSNFRSHISTHDFKIETIL